MKKRLLALLFCAVMVCAVFVQAAPGVFAADVLRQQCGKNLTAVLNINTGVLTFEGSGAMSYEEGAYFSDWSVYIKKIVIPEGVTNISEYAFNDCINLRTVSIANSVTSIEDAAFQGCGLRNVEIPAGVLTLGFAVFNACNNLQSILVNKSNPAYRDIDGVLFTKDGKTLVQFPCARDGSYTIPQGVEVIDSMSFCWSSISDVTIPNSVWQINWSAFCASQNLNELRIPASVTNIDTPICDGTNLSGIWVAPENPAYCSDSNGALYTKNYVSLLECPTAFSGKFVVHTNTAKIGRGAFSGLEHLTEVSFPDGLTSIGDAAFSLCTSLTKLVLPKSLEEIDCGAFSSCWNLKEIVFQSNIREINDQAFQDCCNLQSVFFMGDAPTINKRAFQIAEYDDETGAETLYNIPGLTLYYRVGASGWTSPSYGADAYPTVVWTTAPYTDAKPGSWYEQSVQYATEHGLMNGTGTNTFEPESTMTRAMLVTVLWRYANAPKPGANPFTDVPNGKWYTDAVAWAAENGVVNGVGDGKFEPDGSVTREQMATILYRYAQKVGIDTSKHTELSAFPDASRVSAYARAPMQWIVAEGVIGGSRENGQDWLNPQGNATRAEVATILMRFIENVAKRPQ